MGKVYQFWWMGGVERCVESESESEIRDKKRNQMHDDEEWEHGNGQTRETRPRQDGGGGSKLALLDGGFFLLEGG